MGTTAKLTCLTLIAVLITTVEISAQSQGLDLKLDRDMVFLGDQDQFGQLTCRAKGNSVKLESFTVMWVNVTGETSDLVRVTSTKPSNRVSHSGILGNGTLENNSGYIFLDRLDADICDSSYFLCEAVFTKSSGESERAIATAWPRQPQTDRSDDAASNNSQHLAALEKRLENISEAFQMFNRSYMELMQTRQKEKLEQAQIMARLKNLEANMSVFNKSQSCDPCSNITRAVENLERRLKHLEKSNMTSEPPQVGTCVRGMNETVQLDYVITTDKTLGREILCDAQTDGGGWIVFQKRFNGSVNFTRGWDEYRDGFGALTGEFWLGNEAVHRLTNMADVYELRVEFTDIFDGQDYFAHYQTFKLGNESDNYRLLLGAVTSLVDESTGDSGLFYSNGSFFSTIDRDNDDSVLTCTDYNPGGWWYKSCFRSRLNDIYTDQGIGFGWYYTTITKWYSLIRTEMKMRPLKSN